MSHCLYPYCTNLSKSENYFRIPENSELRKRWMSAIPQVLGLTKDTLVSKQFLCSKHFAKSNFHLDKDGKITSMKSNAVPSIFFVPSSSSDQGKSTMEEVQEVDEPMDTGPPLPTPPAIPPTLSDGLLFAKVRQEELKLLIFKERVKKEEENLVTVQETMRTVEKDSKSRETEELYSNLMKKMRPIAPKRPQKRRPKTLEEIIVHFKKERLMSHEALSVLMYLFADVPVEERPTAISKEAIHCFAQYMTFYNTEVYENIHSNFDIILPPVSAIRMLTNKSVGEPGWSHAAFTSLQRLSSKYENGNKFLCSLLVSGMSIKRKEEWDGKKIRGYVDCGPQMSGAGFDMDSDAIPTARSVLALMVVPLEPHLLWRVPVAYFYVNRLSAGEKANIIRECILRLHSVGAVALSVTCNVPFSDKNLLDLLGVSSDLLPQMCPYFVHPADPLLRVHVIFDHCSVLTSVQNMWASCKGFQDNEGRSIQWKFVSDLIKLQEAQATGLAQTLDSPLWTWDSLLMKNRLLAQLFSEVTADAMEYCRDVLKLSQFLDCEGTVYFLRIMSRISNLLKSRRFTKTRPKGQDEAFLKSEFHIVLDYLYHLQNEKDEPLHSGKTGSIRLLYQTLMSCQELLRQVPGFSPHCVSLDELEIIFYIIRTYTGWCSMPTARQFTAAFTSHLEKCGYIASWGCALINCYWWVDTKDVSVARREGRLISKPELQTSCLPVNMTAQISAGDVYPETDSKSFSVSQFIAVCVVKSLGDILNCEVCIEALQETPVSDNPLALLLRKTCGAMLCPSVDVLRVCAYAERHLQSALRISKVEVKSSLFEWNDKDFINRVVLLVVKDFQEEGLTIFSSLGPHLLECSPESSHLYRLLRGISWYYVLVRLRSYKSWCQI